MKLVFAGCALFLAGATGLLLWHMPDQRSPVPVLYWVTQNDEYKRAIVSGFRAWLRAENLPDVDLRIDNTNQDATKKLVQGVAGVGSDLMDLPGPQLDLFASTGLLLDVTAAAAEGGFAAIDTYPALQDSLLLDGRQYSFPRNAGSYLYWVNRETFAQLGLSLPPRRWNADEFEELGRKFVAAANPPGTRHRAYFANKVSREVLRRGLGLGTFNETGTRCMLDDPRNAAVLERVRRWIREDRLMPTREEDAAMLADAAGSRNMFAHLVSGRFGMVYTGHWALMMLRSYGDLSLAVVEPPQDGFANTETGGGGVGVYAGTKHPEHAVRFLQYLGSDDYNRLIVRMADNLPPVPRYTKLEEFLRPAGRENEWGLHGAFADAALNTNIYESTSPFLLQSAVFRLELEIFEIMLSGRLSPAEAATQMAERINEEIALAVRRSERLRALYEERAALQRRIEEKRAAGERVPAAWVTDTFHRAHYRAQGWLEEER